MNSERPPCGLYGPVPVGRCPFVSPLVFLAPGGADQRGAGKKGSSASYRLLLHFLNSPFSSPPPPTPILNLCMTPPFPFPAAAAAAAAAAASSGKKAWGRSRRRPPPPPPLSDLGGWGSGRDRGGARGGGKGGGGGGGGPQETATTDDGGTEFSTYCSIDLHFLILNAIFDQLAKVSSNFFQLVGEYKEDRAGRWKEKRKEVGTRNRFTTREGGARNRRRVLAAAAAAAAAAGGERQTVFIAPKAG